MKEKRDIREEKRHRECRICGGRAGLIRKYGLHICRRCFKDVAERIGFKKFD
jgi:ribosomal protein S14